MTKEASSDLCFTFLVNILSFLCIVGRESCWCAFTTTIIYLEDRKKKLIKQVK
jgi:hypothetical protein